MTIPRRWRRVLLGLGGAMLATTGVVAQAEAANCGDTAGPFWRRVPCACGDTVVTNTKLRATDPVVATICDLADAALTIGANGIRLDCRGHTLRGDAAALSSIAAALRGIVAQRNGVTIQNCSLRHFSDGIVVVGDRNHVIGNATAETLGGLILSGNDNWVAGNRAEHCEVQGLDLIEGRGNVIWKNRIANCFDGLVIEGDKNWLAENVSTDNGRLGFHVLGSDNTLIFNAARRNGETEELGTGHGFEVVGHGNRLANNLATDSEGKGFCVVPGNVNGGQNFASGNGVTPEVDFACSATATPDSL